MLKAAVAALGALVLGFAAPAAADTLITGAIRDAAGVAVSGAAIAAFDAAGRPVGHDTASTDGTFALAARTAPATVTVTCDYCRPVGQAVTAGEPVIVIVRRFVAVSAKGPSPADLRALPYRSASDLASLGPLSVIDTGRISDRGLDSEGAVLVNGMPFYNPADGSDYSNLVPAHAVAGFEAVSPLAAPTYGGYADAGLFDVRLRDADLATTRADTGDASDVVARVNTANAGAGYAASSDLADDRQAANANVSFPLGDGHLAVDALAMADSVAHASGAQASYLTGLGRTTGAVTVAATQTDDSALVAASARVRGGPLGLEFGARATRSTSNAASGIAGAQFDAAVFVDGARRVGANVLAATVALDRGSNSLAGGGGSQSTALIGSLADDLRLRSHWTLHVAAVSNVRLPVFAEFTGAGSTLPGDRTLLLEQSLTYTELRRVRIAASTYTQRSTGALTSHVAGIGLDAAWQIAPLLAVRSWYLRANESSLATATSAPIPPYGGNLRAAGVGRQLIWFTYEKYVRFDALVRAGALEGDVRIPIGATYAFALGSAIYNHARVTTFGLTLR